jgi:hypothetical protein
MRKGPRSLSDASCAGPTGTYVSLEHIDAGRQLGEFGAHVGAFFCTRGTERRMVSITPTAPGTLDEYGAARTNETTCTRGSISVDLSSRDGAGHVRQGCELTVRALSRCGPAWRR